MMLVLCIRPMIFTGLIDFLIISPFALAFTVLSWKKLNDSNANRFYTKTATYLFLGMLFTAHCCFSVYTYLIKVFTLNTDYWSAMKIVPWLAHWLCLYTGFTLYAVFSYYVTKKTNFMLLIYTSSLTAKISLNILLINPR